MEKVGRNDPCPCGSGKKFKKCCETKQNHKKINAQVLAPQAQETKDTSKVSSLFFKRASAPKAPPVEPPNPVM
jgi:SEC-C motif